MKIETTKPKRYKDFMIVGLAIEAPRLEMWKLRGIIYSGWGIELKRLELKQARFWDEKSAQYYALKMCRYWIDNYRYRLDRLVDRTTER